MADADVFDWAEDVEEAINRGELVDHADPIDTAGEGTTAPPNTPEEGGPEPEQTDVGAAPGVESPPSSESDKVFTDETSNDSSNSSD